jgi:hypothetical protein
MCGTGVARFGGGVFSRVAGTERQADYPWRWREPAPVTDADAALRIRKRLERNPPNDGARFVDFALSETGLQVTRS